MLLQNYKSNNAIGKENKVCIHIEQRPCLADYSYILMCYPRHVFIFVFRGDANLTLFSLFSENWSQTIVCNQVEG
jgi:hypothetical protein